MYLIHIKQVGTFTDKIVGIGTIYIVPIRLYFHVPHIKCYNLIRYLTNIILRVLVKEFKKFVWF